MTLVQLVLLYFYITVKAEVKGLALSNSPREWQSWALDSISWTPEPVLSVPCQLHIQSVVKKDVGPHVSIRHMLQGTLFSLQGLSVSGKTRWRTVFTYASSVLLKKIICISIYFL